MRRGVERRLLLRRRWRWVANQRESISPGLPPPPKLPAVITSSAEHPSFPGQGPTSSRASRWLTKWLFPSGLRASGLCDNPGDVPPPFTSAVFVPLSPWGLGASRGRILWRFRRLYVVQLDGSKAVSSRVSFVACSVVVTGRYN